MKKVIKMDILFTMRIDLVGCRCTVKMTDEFVGRIELINNKKNKDMVDYETLNSLKGKYIDILDLSANQDKTKLLAHLEKVDNEISAQEVQKEVLKAYKEILTD